MMKRILIATCAMVAVAGASYGEAQRTTLTVENRFPELKKLEAGGIFEAREFSDNGDHLNTLAAYGRYGLYENLTVYASVPYAQSNRDWSDDGMGIGDIKIGLQLLAYQDIFEYPWIVPHAEVSFGTGDEDEGLGYGEDVYTLGISVGSKMYDKISFIADVSYAINAGYESGMVPDSTFGAHETLDAVIIAGSIVWDVSDRLALLAEGKLVQDNNTAEEQQPRFGSAGMVYKFSDRFQLGGYVGGWTDADGQTDVIVRGSYDF